MFEVYNSGIYLDLDLKRNYDNLIVLASFRNAQIDRFDRGDVPVLHIRFVDVDVDQRLLFLKCTLLITWYLQILIYTFKIMWFGL